MAPVMVVAADIVVVVTAEDGLGLMILITLIIPGIGG